jgi:hypothetical protein
MEVSHDLGSIAETRYGFAIFDIKGCFARDKTAFGTFCLIYLSHVLLQAFSFGKRGDA